MHNVSLYTGNQRLHLITGQDSYEHRVELSLMHNVSLYTGNQRLHLITGQDSYEHIGELLLIIMFLYIQVINGYI